MGLMNRDGGQIETPLRCTLRLAKHACLPKHRRPRAIPPVTGSRAFGVHRNRAGGGQAPGRGGVTARAEEILTPHGYVGNSQELPRVSVVIYYWMVNCQIAAAPIDVAGALRDWTL